jgi:hypothetical protein
MGGGCWGSRTSETAIFVICASGALFGLSNGQLFAAWLVLHQGVGVLLEDCILALWPA